MHVVAKNLQSIQAKERVGDFMVGLDTFEFDLLLLSETWRGDREEHLTTAGGHKVFFSGGSAGRLGVGICTSRKLLNKIGRFFFCYSDRVQPNAQLLVPAKFLDHRVPCVSWTTCTLMSPTGPSQDAGQPTIRR